MRTGRAAVIVPAAGRGRRTGLKTPKPFILFGGVPLIAHTIDLFQRHRQVSLVQPVLPRSGLLPFRRRILQKYSWGKCRPPVAGGRDRQDSVLKGLKSLPDDVDVIIVHDAARPFVTSSLISAVIDGALKHGAAIAAVPVKDTVKKASHLGLVRTTVDRSDLWLAQTPQAFRAGLLREAHAWAETHGFRGTDDASIVEELGHPVRLVPGSNLNLKITTREDIAVARLLLADRREIG